MIFSATTAYIEVREQRSTKNQRFTPGIVGMPTDPNGLIRQYIPKGKDFAELSDADIIVILEKLNNRPRKSLDYTTPNEIFEQLQKKAS